MSALAMVDGGVGSTTTPAASCGAGRFEEALMTIMCGSLILAPLLFVACGVLGLLACLIRRER